MHERTVLVIDDNEDALALLQFALRTKNFKVSAVSDGEAAFEYLKRESLPDLILLDLTLMRGMSGSEFLTQLRGDEKLRDCKVIIVSGLDDLAIRARELGADGYLRKPFDLSALFKAIDPFF